MPNVCLTLRCDGSYDVFRSSHKTLHTHLGGRVTFVGAINDANVVALGSDRNSSSEANATCARFPDYFEPDVAGDVILAGSDVDGRACDVDVPLVICLLGLANQAS